MNRLESLSAILNYNNYYQAGEIETGIHGPEEVDGKVFISIYHWMQFNNINTRDYNIYKIGQEFSTMTSQKLTCKYENQRYEIGKYDYWFIEENQDVFEKYLN